MPSLTDLHATTGSPTVPEGQAQTAAGMEEVKTKIKTMLVHVTVRISKFYAGFVRSLDPKAIDSDVVKKRICEKSKVA